MSGLDREGRLLADVLRGMDPAGAFRYLVVEDASSLERMKAFLIRANVPGATLPFIVFGRTQRPVGRGSDAMEDTTGQATERHQVVHGEALGTWFHNTLHSMAEQKKISVTHLRDLVASHLSVATLTLVGLCVREDEATEPVRAPPVVVAPEPEIAAVPPPTNSPRPSPVNTRPIAMKARQSRRESTSESIAVVADPVVGTDAWTESSVPEPRREKVVNIADAMGHARMRTEPSRELTARSPR